MYFLLYLSSIIIKESVQPVLPILDQIREGLKCYNLLEKVQLHPDLMKYVFCNDLLFQWTFHKFEEFAKPSYSEEGSTRRAKEIDVFKAFLDVMEHCFYEGK